MEVLGSYADSLDDSFVSIDGRDFTIMEFVKMMTTYAGWGARIIFVDQEELHIQPEIEVREPSKEEK